jgi:uncharacterized protein YkwD
MTIRTPLVAAAALLLLAGCAEEPRLPTVPTFYQHLDSSTARLDAPTAAGMISSYRAQQGLPPVRLDPVLEEVATEQARAMAARDNVRVSLQNDRDLQERLEKAGYRTTVAVESVSAGYRTVAEMFSGLRESKPQNEKLLTPGATRIGIAIAYAPASKYRVFWSVVLAGEPQQP